MSGPSHYSMAAELEHRAGLLGAVGQRDAALRLAIVADGLRAVAV